MNNKDQFRRWGGISAIASGVIFLVPLIFYFSLLPAAGSSATHAKNPSSFLPWMAAQGDLRIALWWIVCVAFMLMLFGTPSALKSILRETNPVSGRISELAGVLGAWAVLSMAAILPYALAFAAGAMIFVVVEELIPESQQKGNADFATLGAMFGFTLMMTLDVALG